MITILIALCALFGRPAPVPLLTRLAPRPTHASTITLSASLPTVAVPTGKAPAPTSSAAAVLAVDVDSGRVLYAKNPDTSRPIASLTKLATVLTILEHHQADELVTVPNLPSYGPDDAILGLQPGQQFRLEDLVAASLISSANDAADALALSDSVTNEAFYSKMNVIASTYGLAGTHFASTNGLIDTDNYATATSLVKLARLDLQQTLVTKLVATAQTSITAADGRRYQLTSTNKLLNGSTVIGVKTGYTPAAGECLVTLAVVQGHQVLTVMLGSADRFGETSALLAWLGSNWSWVAAK